MLKSIYYRCPWYSNSFDECGDRAIKNLEKTINYEGANNIAAIMMEGESGTSGCKNILLFKKSRRVM